MGGSDWYAQMGWSRTAGEAVAGSGRREPLRGIRACESRCCGLCESTTCRLTGGGGWLLWCALTGGSSSPAPSTHPPSPIC